MSELETSPAESLVGIAQTPEGAQSEILRMAGRGRNVLACGTASAALAAALAHRDDARMTALVPDANAVERIGNLCERVIQLKPGETSWPDVVGDTTFDTVVLSEVLEHAPDPWATLREAVGVLSENGAIVASIPHAAHAAILGALVSGNSTRTDDAHPNRAPPRLFSIQDIQAMFDDAGLVITDFAYVLKAPEETNLAAMWRALPSRTKAPLQEGPFAHVWQVVLEARVATSRTALPGHRLAELPPAAASKLNLKLIAFYLPQFHPIPENDEWWGKGFTEWTNTAKAEPLFPGHYQPHHPSELGYYDLRLRDTQRDQIALAKQFGVDAFCFHYYWFGGRRLLEKPLLDFLADGDANIGFCVNWANENWTRKWDGSHDELLLEQVYSPEHDLEFISGLLPFFVDPRYLRVDGRPVLLVYAPQNIPDPVATAERWRIFCRENGVGEIHLVAALTHNNWNYEKVGFDAGVEFPPHNLVVPNLNDRWPFEAITGLVTPYREAANLYLARDYTTRRVYRTVVPSWDNTARVRERAVMLLDGDPPNYERWLEAAAVKTITEREPGDRLLFINAWNEWAEGCHLEPDHRFGSAFLEATRRVKDGRSMIDPIFPEPSLPSPPPVSPPEPLGAPPNPARRLAIGGSSDARRPASLAIPVMEVGRTTELVPADVEVVHIITPAFRPDVNDRRRLGALITRLTVDGVPLPLDDPALTDGFHAIELHGGLAVRWTDGVGSVAIGTGRVDRFIEIDVSRIVERPPRRLDS